MPTTMFCSVDDVRAYLLTEAGYTNDDALIKAQIKQATVLIRNYTRRDWDRANYVDYFGTHDIDIAIRQGSDYAAFNLREKNVSVADGEYPVIKFNTGGDWTSATEISTESFSVDTRLNRIIIYPVKMRSYGRSLRVSYTAGYAADGDDADVLLAPGNIKQCCIAQSAWQVRRVLNDTLGSSREGSNSRNAYREITKSGFVREALAFLQTETRIFVGSNA